MLLRRVSVGKRNQLVRHIVFWFGSRLEAGVSGRSLMRRILALAVLAVAVAPVLPGATPSGAASKQAERASTTVFPPDDSAPVPVPEPTEKAMRFYRSGNVLWCIRTVWELSVPALILFSGLSARLSRWA